MNEHLMTALLYAALPFETSSDEKCDPDLAVSQLEGIAPELEKLTVAEQADLRRFAYDKAERPPVPQVREQIRVLLDGLLPHD